MLVHTGTEIGGGLRRQRRNKFLCHRYDLFVDVERLGWADTVVYPRRFNIRYCAGRCPLVIRPPNIDVSNHAVLRALVRHHHRHRSACCVATSLRPMNLLYRDKQGHFDIWKINDVIVDTCGCRWNQWNLRSIMIIIGVYVSSSYHAWYMDLLASTANTKLTDRTMWFITSYKTALSNVIVLYCYYCDANCNSVKRKLQFCQAPFNMV